MFDEKTTHVPHTANGNGPCKECQEKAIEDIGGWVLGLRAAVTRHDRSLWRIEMQQAMIFGAVVYLTWKIGKAK